MKVSRHVDERVEGHDEIERRRRELNAGHVPDDERGVGDLSSSGVDRPRRDVDTRHSEAELNEASRCMPSGAASEVQRVVSLAEQFEGPVDVAVPESVVSCSRPVGVHLMQSVIAVCDDQSRVRLPDRRHVAHDARL